MISAVLFDLDGTLLDTGPDIAHALNLLRAEHGHLNADWPTHRMVSCAVPRTGPATSSWRSAGRGRREQLVLNCLEAKAM